MLILVTAKVKKYNGYHKIYWKRIVTFGTIND